MRASLLFARGRTLIAISLVGAVTGLALGVGLTVNAIQSHDETPYVKPPECTGFGSASFIEAESLDDLLGRADVVVKGRIAERSNSVDAFGPEGRSPEYSNHRFIVYTVDIQDVLVGDVSGESTTLGMSFGEACLDPGDEFYLFMAKNREPGEPYIDNPDRFDNPAEYGLRSFGPQNVFAVESGVVRQMEGWSTPNLSQFDGISEDLFRNAVLESAERVR